MTNKETVKEAAEGAAIAAAQASGPQTRAVVRVVFISLMIVLGFIAAVFVLRALTGVLLLVVLAIFFAYLVSPLVEFLRRPLYLGGRKRIMPRALAIGIVYLVLFGALGIGISFLYPSLKNQVEEFVQNSPQYFQNAKQSNTVQRLKRTYNQLPEKARGEIDAKISQAVAETGQSIINLTSLLGYVPTLILIPILAFFL
ncbi:MAG: AI-2E family transporter, partial [Acidobacteria bacterium]|nr:AI-2E family transporter [Acidobacteriota bacterium]